MWNQFAHIKYFTVWTPVRSKRKRVCRVMTTRGQALADFFHQRDANAYMATLPPDGSW